MAIVVELATTEFVNVSNFHMALIVQTQVCFYYLLLHCCLFITFLLLLDVMLNVSIDFSASSLILSLLDIQLFVLLKELKEIDLLGSIQ